MYNAMQLPAANNAERVSHPLRSSREARKEFKDCRDCGNRRIPEYRTTTIATVS
jgi:hypothetical protein